MVDPKGYIQQRLYKHHAVQVNIFLFRKIKLV